MQLISLIPPLQLGCVVFFIPLLQIEVVLSCLYLFCKYRLCCLLYTSFANRGCVVLFIPLLQLGGCVVFFIPLLQIEVVLSSLYLFCS